MNATAEQLPVEPEAPAPPPPFTDREHAICRDWAKRELVADPEGWMHVDDVREEYSSFHRRNPMGTSTTYGEDLAAERYAEAMTAAGFEIVPGSDGEGFRAKLAPPSAEGLAAFKAKHSRIKQFRCDTIDRRIARQDAREGRSNVVPYWAAQPAPAAPALVGPPVWVAATERALKVGEKVARIKTGIASIDAACRGGIQLRKLVVAGGAPGAGKTALAIQIAFRCVTAGIHVAFLAADEDADSLLVRFGQQAGLSRDLLEDGDEAERAKLAAWCASVPLMLVDGDDSGSTVENVSKELRKRAGSAPSALFADSIQTVRTNRQPPKGGDIRAKVNVTVAELKHAAKVDGHMVMVTSEISKAAYRNKAQAENVSALSAFKESGDIEYGVALALVLTSRQGVADVIDAVIAKNRLGPGKPSFMLRLDPDRAGVFETTAAEAAELDPLFMVKAEILDGIATACGQAISKEMLYTKVGGRKAKFVMATNELLEAKVLIHDRRGGLRRPLPGDIGYVKE